MKVTTTNRKLLPKITDPQCLLVITPNGELQLQPVNSVNNYMLPTMVQNDDVKRRAKLLLNQINDNLLKFVEAHPMNGLKSLEVFSNKIEIMDHWKLSEALESFGSGKFI